MPRPKRAKDPTPTEIRRRCQLIQAGWSERERRERIHGTKAKRHEYTRQPRVTRLHCPLAPDDLMTGLFS